MSFFAKITSKVFGMFCYKNSEGILLHQSFSSFGSRVITGLFFSLLFLSTLVAADSSDPAQEFLLAYQNFQQAERLERAGKKNEAIAKYHYAEGVLKNLSSKNPDWQQPVVDYRLHKVRDNLARLNGTISENNLENEEPSENVPSAEMPSANNKSLAGEFSDREGEQKSDDTAPSISITPPTTKKNLSDQQINQLQKQLKKTELELQKAHNDLNDKATELDHSKVAVVDMKSQLEKTERQVIDLKADLSKARLGRSQREEALQQSVRVLESKVDTLAADQEVVLEENKQLQDHLKLATESLVAGLGAKQRLEQLQLEMNAGKNDSAALHQKLLIAQNERDATNELNSTLKKQLLEATTSLSSVEQQAQEATALRAQVEKLHVDDAEKSKLLATVQEHAKNLEENQKALTGSLQKEIAEAQNNQRILEEEKKGLEGKLKKANDEMISLQKTGADETALQAQIAAMKNEQQESAKHLAEATLARNALEKSHQQALAEAESKSQAMMYERQAVEAKKLELEKQLVEANGKIKAITESLPNEAAVQEEIAQYKKQLQASASKLIEQEKKIDVLEKAQPEKDRLLQVKEKELADARLDSDKLQKDLVSANQKLSTLQAEVQVKDDHYNQLKTQLDQKNEELLALKKKGESHPVQDKAIAENELLKGIVIRELKAEAKRQQIKKLITEDLEKLKVNSVTLSSELKKLAKPVKLTPEEKALFKDAPNALPSSSNNEEEGEDSLMISVAASKKEDHSKEASSEAKATPRSSPSNLNKNNNAEDASLDGEKNKSNDSEQHRELIAKAKEQFEHQNYSEAEKNFQDSLAIVPNDYLTLSNLGVVEFQLGKMTEAESVLKKAAALDHKKSFALTTLGIVHYRQERMEDAEKDLRQAIAINDQDFTAHNYLGIVLAASGKGKAGESEIMKALEINPQYADAHFNLAVIYSTSKPPAKQMAKTHYTKAISLGAPPDASLEKLLN